MQWFFKFCNFCKKRVALPIVFALRFYMKSSAASLCQKTIAVKLRIKPPFKLAICSNLYAKFLFKDSLIENSF